MKIRIRETNEGTNGLSIRTRGKKRYESKCGTIRAKWGDVIEMHTLKKQELEAQKENILQRRRESSMWGRVEGVEKRTERERESASVENKSEK